MGKADDQGTLTGLLSGEAITQTGFKEEARDLTGAFVVQIPVFSVYEPTQASSARANKELHDFDKLTPINKLEPLQPREAIALSRCPGVSC